MRKTSRTKKRYNCHYTLHADVVGTRNIVMRTLLIQQDWVRTGMLSLPLMCQALKPKHDAFPGRVSCDGAETQAPAL